MTAIEDQRVAFPVFVANNAADNDLVITAIVHTLCLALKDCRILRKDGHTGQALRAIQSSELVGTALCEAIANVSLMHCQYVDGEMLGVDEGLEAERIIGDAPKHQRWLQRYGCKTVDCNARFFTVLIDRCHDGDAGGK